MTEEKLKVNWRKMHQIALVRANQPKYADLPFDDLRLCYTEDGDCVAAVFSGKFLAIGVAKRFRGTAKTWNGTVVAEWDKKPDTLNRPLARKIAIGRALHALKEGSTQGRAYGKGLGVTLIREQWLDDMPQSFPGIEALQSVPDGFFAKRESNAEAEKETEVQA